MLYSGLLYGFLELLEYFLPVFFLDKPSEEDIFVRQWLMVSALVALVGTVVRSDLVFWELENISCMN